eukprot:848829-Pleurochrysis_carterae.AAC.1
MVKADHLRRAVDGLQQQFVVLHGHEAEGFRKAEFIAYLPERRTWLTRASLVLWVIGGVSTKQPRRDSRRLSP